MSGLNERLNECTQGEQKTALEWLAGYTPEAVRMALSFVESHRKPPRIPEPEFGERVVASLADDNIRRVWVRFITDGVYRWVADGTRSVRWSDLIEPSREGLS